MTSSASQVQVQCLWESSLAMASGHMSYSTSVTTRYVWLGINKDVRRWAKMCVKCKKSQIHRHVVTPCQPLSLLMHDVIHCMVRIDIVGPLPSHGFTYILTSVDRFTLWPEAIPIADIMAEKVDQAFIHVGSWIAQFGIRLTLSTDRGRQFDSSLWNKLMHC